MTDDEIKAELTEEQQIDFSATKEWLLQYGHRKDGTGQDFGRLCKLVQKTLTSLVLCHRENRELRERLKNVHLGRLYCGQCEEYDHNCGCDPNIVERTRARLLRGIE